MSKYIWHPIYSASPGVKEDYDELFKFMERGYRIISVVADSGRINYILQAPEPSQIPPTKPKREIRV